MAAELEDVMTNRTVNGKPVEAEGTLVLGHGSSGSFMIDSMSVEIVFDPARDTIGPDWSDVPGGVRAVFPDALPAAGSMLQTFHWAGVTYEAHIWCQSVGAAPRSHLVHYTVTR